jgi:predicted amidohydrolase
MTGDLRAGIAQWTPGRDPDVNLRKAEAALRELARRGCQLAVLPELWLCGYRTATLAADARAVAEPADGRVQQRLAAVAPVDRSLQRRRLPVRGLPWRALADRIRAVRLGLLALHAA